MSNRKSSPKPQPVRVYRIDPSTGEKTLVRVEPPRPEKVDRFTRWLRRRGLA